MQVKCSISIIPYIWVIKYTQSIYSVNTNNFEILGLTNRFLMFKQNSWNDNFNDNFNDNIDIGVQMIDIYRHYDTDIQA